MPPVKWEMNVNPIAAPETTVDQLLRSPTKHKEYEVPDEQVKQELERRLEEVKDVLHLP